MSGGGSGDILVFLPGGEEVDRLVHMVKDRYDDIYSNNSYDKSSDRSSLYVLPCYGALPSHSQMLVFQPAPKGCRKVVIATNICETSLTIEGIKYVIDSSFVNLNYYDVRSGIDMLITCPISQASARQRAGRCGRTRPGKCYRLLTEEAYLQLSPHTTPEMQRVDASWAVLQLKALGINDIIHFDFISPPSVDSMIAALELLYSLGALDDECILTHTGEQMAEMPCDPKMAKALLQSYQYGCSEEMLTIVSMCNVEYPFISPHYTRGHNSDLKQNIEESKNTFISLEGDHITLLNIYKEYTIHSYSDTWCDSVYIQSKIMKQARELRNNLHKLLLRCTPSPTLTPTPTTSTPTTHLPDQGGTMVIASCGDDVDAIKKCLISGYFKNIAKLGNDGTYYTLKGNQSVTIYNSSVYYTHGIPPTWVLYNEVIQSRVPAMREVCSIQPLWVAEIASHYYELKNITL